MMSPAFSILASFCWYVCAVFAGSIKICNTTPSPICYAVEISEGFLPTNTICNQIMPGVIVDAHQNITLTPTPGFNGAFTDFRNGTRGARHEINFDTPGLTWYDIDYEMGISNSTVGPLDGRNQTKGLHSLAGEADCLAKANLAWHTTSNKPNLAPHYYYLVHDPLNTAGAGNLTNLRMDNKAPLEVTWFLQMEANLTAYVWHGSVADAESVLNFKRIHVDAAGRAEALEMLNRAADKHSWTVGGQEMVITAY